MLTSQVSSARSFAAGIRVYLGPGQGHQVRSFHKLNYLQSDVNYTWLVWADGQRVLLPRTLSYFVARLPAADFIRIHRQWVVNRHRVFGVEREGYVVALHTGERLSVSRRRQVAVRRALSGSLG